MSLATERYLQLDSILSPDWSAPHKTSKDRQQAYEARVAAAVVYILREVRGRRVDRTGIYLNGLHEQAPDVKVAYLNPLGEPERELPIEIVTFNQYSAPEGIIRFFHRTKLSQAFAYEEDTAIICHIDLPICDPSQTSRRISAYLNALEESAVRHPMFLYQTGEDGSEYLALIYPGFEEFTPIDTFPIPWE